jgi:hypothetical protein
MSNEKMYKVQGTVPHKALCLGRQKQEQKKDASDYHSSGDDE